MNLSFAGRFLREPYKSQSARRDAGMSWLDVKLGVRMLVKYPGLTLIGALGITVAVALAVAWFEFRGNINDPRLPIWRATGSSVSQL